MNIACARGSTERHRREAAVPDDLELHPSANGFRHAVHPAQGLHLHGVVGGAPRQQAGLEWMCGGRCV
jgi:hypothetical protein